MPRKTSAPSKINIGRFAGDPFASSGGINGMNGPNGGMMNGMGMPAAWAAWAAWVAGRHGLMSMRSGWQAAARSSPGRLGPRTTEGSVPCVARELGASCSSSVWRAGSAWGLSGCGYSVRPPGYPDVQTVYVPIFRSITFRRDVQLMLTEAVIKEIEERTPYKVVGSPEEADTILEGTINFADKNIVVENPYNLPRELNAWVQATVRWTHNPPLEQERNATAGHRRRDGQLHPRSRRDRDDRLLQDLPEPGHTDRRYDGRALVDERSSNGEIAELTHLDRSSDAAPMTTLGSLWPGDRDATAVPRVMGIVNVTPDSFSDGGRCLRARRRRGARACGWSTRGPTCSTSAASRAGRGPSRCRSTRSCGGSSRWSRRWRARVGVPISVDTTKAEVARRALAAGASIINDIPALGGDPELARVVAESGAGVVLMHMAGTPRDHAGRPALRRRRRRGPRLPGPPDRGCRGAGHRPGADRDRPGHRLRQDVRRTTWSSCGTSINLPPWDVRSWSAPRARGSSARSPAGPSTSVPSASVVSSLAAAVGGAGVVRVHDVAAMVDAIKIWTAIHGWDDAP